MILRVCENLRDRLLEEPESGMGYQIATLAGGARYIIMNAEVAVALPTESSDRTGLRLELATEELGTLTMGTQRHRSHKMVEAILARSEELVAEDAAALRIERHHSYPSRSEPGEEFRRYSAFRYDARVNPDGSIQPGSYVTTATDAAQVPSGLAAVARYALPNTTPAVFEFTVRPPRGTAILCGTVRPDYGQAGGGVEVLLTDGAPADSVLGPSTIAER